MDRRIIVLFAAICLGFVLLGCSQVFEAGISGTVVTKDGTRDEVVSNVSVFAYTDKGLRNSDLAKFRAGTIKRPSEGSGYVATTTTNANGEFVVNKIVWETKKSEFGKTADVNELYLIFYHEDYVVTSADATIISGSTNQSNVYVMLEGNKDYTTINVTVYDVATWTAMTDSCTLEYQVEGKDSSDSIVISNTGTATLRISYPKDTTPDVTFKLTSPGSGWRMSNRDGGSISQYVQTDVEEGSLNVSLYMKSFDFTLPAFSGDIDGSLTELADPNSPYKAGVDNISISLQYWGKENDEYKWIPFYEVTYADHRTRSERVVQGTDVYYQHGLFSGVGNSGYSIRINEETYPGMGFVIEDQYNHDWDDLTGRTTTIRLRLVFGNNDKEYKFSYTIRNSSDLGHIALTTPITPTPE